MQCSKPLTFHLDASRCSFNIGHRRRRSPRKSIDSSKTRDVRRREAKSSLSREMMWPSGIRADPNPDRDESIRHITQVLCKAKLLGIVSGQSLWLSLARESSPWSLDELRHIIGSETTRRGLLRLFELLQNASLNRRFVYVVLESLLIKLFRPNELNLLFDKLYSQSSRVKEEHRRRIFEEDHHQHGVILTEQHYSESHTRPYYFNRLTVRTDDSKNLPRKPNQDIP